MAKYEITKKQIIITADNDEEHRQIVNRLLNWQVEEINEMKLERKIQNANS